ncbi:transcriptional regulator [Klebsiella electrica]
MLNDSDLEIMLSNQAARLLLEMVINNNETLHRDDLLKKVWEEYGFTPSNNSLNIAVSEIRKAFEAYGRDPKIIKTIPKVGFRFEGNVTAGITQKEKEKEKEKESGNEGKSERVIRNYFPGFNLFVNQRVGRKFFILVANIIIIIVITFYLLFINHYAGRKTIRRILVTNFELCNIYITDGAKLKNAQKTLANSDYRYYFDNCNKIKYDIYYDDIINTNEFASVFLAKCSLGEGGICESNLIFKRK